MPGTHERAPASGTVGMVPILLALVLVPASVSGAEETPAVCRAAPAAGCDVLLAPRKSVLRLKHGRRAAGDRAQWRWSGVGVAAVAPLGDPRGETSYELCVYDGEDHPLLGVELPGGVTCDDASRQCWRTRAHGVRYRDRAATRAGVTRVSISVGRRRTRILLKGKGARLALPDLEALRFPLTVQLRNGAGTCWSAVYPEYERRRRGRMKARTD